MAKVRIGVSIIGILSIVIISGNPFLIVFAILGASSGIILNFLQPMHKLRDYIKSVLTPHRTLFEIKLSENGNTVNKFKETVTTEFDWINEDDPSSMYVHVMSYLELASLGRARLFQAVFSFCRSMWILLIFYSCIYIAIGVSFSPPNWVPDAISRGILALSSYDPVISSQLNGDLGMMICGIGMILLSIIFFHSEGQYKRIFTEYFVADFLVLIESEPADKPEP